MLIQMGVILVFFLWLLLVVVVSCCCFFFVGVPQYYVFVLNMCNKLS